MIGAAEKEPRLRVLMTTDAVGGVWTYTIDLAQGLAARGVETRLAVLGPTPSAAQTAAAEAAGLTLHPTGLPLDWLAADRGEVEAAGDAVARLAAESGADLVHLNAPALAAGGHFRMPVVAACHSCTKTWWRAVRSGPLPKSFEWQAELVASGYARAAVLVAPTHAFARVTRESYGRPGLPVVVHNGRAAHAFAGRGSESFFFTAGRLWDAGKNASGLDRVAEGLPWPVIAAGPTEGPEGSSMAPHNILTLGPLGAAEVAAWLRKTPVFVSLARYEPFGLAVLEAAQAGCALVLADIPSFRELWEGVAAFVPLDDDAAARAAMRAVMQDRTLRDRLGAAAAARAARYSVPAMAAGMEAIYRGLVPGDRSVPSAGAAPLAGVA